MATLLLLRSSFRIKTSGFLALLVVLSSVCYLTILAQKERKSESPPKPKFGEPIEENNSKPSAIVGSLEVATTPRAKVILTNLRDASFKREMVADYQGLIEVSKLKPGKYRIELSHDDYVPQTENVTIIRGKKVRLIRRLTEKFGTVTLGVAEPAAFDVTVRVNGKTIPSGDLKIEEDRIRVPRLPVGKQQISLSSPGYDELLREIEIKPGESLDNMILVMMARSVIALTIESRPGAEVYLNNEPKGQILATGELTISNLVPDTYKLQVSLPGYENHQSEIELSLSKRVEKVTIDLTPQEEDPEVSVDFNSTISHWTPNLLQGWNPVQGKPSGLKVTGNEVRLLKKTTQPNREFNFYRNFELVLDVSFTNGQGAAWVVRARDERNYYLFELTTSRNCSNPQMEKCLIFYVCRNDKCDPQSSIRVSGDIDIEKPGASLRISLTATGDRFTHKLPDKNNVLLGRPVTDSTFTSGGGVGLRAINGLEMFVRQFTVIPHK